ncbi:MAG: hypothetical protein ACE5H9_03945 [Anaerolineae bacterium]
MSKIGSNILIDMDDQQSLYVRCEASEQWGQPHANNYDLISDGNLVEGRLLLGVFTSASTMFTSLSNFYKEPAEGQKPGQEWFWTEEWQAAEKAVEADLAAGRYETFDTMEEFLADLE